MSDPRTEIVDLVHRYSDAVTRFDPVAWSETWTENAQWDLGKGRTFRGKDEIVSFWRSAMDALVIVVQMVHNGSVTLEADGVTATGRWYVAEHVHRQNGAKEILLAWYDDVYTYENKAWHFSSRTLTRLYGGPADLSSSFTLPRGSGWAERASQD